VPEYQKSCNKLTGEKDKVRVISYTIEGYSIIHDLEYNEKNIKSTKDYTRDKSGSGKIEITTCESIGIKENHEKISYMVENCESPSIENGILAIWK
jgi:hypothetical protein